MAKEGKKSSNFLINYKNSFLEVLSKVGNTIRIIVGICISAFYKIILYCRKKMAVILVASVTLVVLAYVVVLYLPPIISDYSRVKFGLRFDCELKVEALTINLVEPPDANIILNLSGFSKDECTEVEIRDDTSVYDLDDRGFASTVKYSDDISEFDAESFDHSEFLVKITKTKLHELYNKKQLKKQKGDDDEIEISFWAPYALTRTSFSRSVLPIFPAITPQSAGFEALEQKTKIIVRAPKGYIFSSSAPHQPKSLVSGDDGVIEARFDYVLNEPGFVVYFENAKGAAIGELFLFFASGVFGFAFGFFVDRLIFKNRNTK